MLVRILIIVIIFIFQIETANSQNWQFDLSPTRQNLARLDMLSDSLGYAVSYDGLILKYNGHAWSVADSLNQIKNYLDSSTDSLLLSPDKLGDIYTIRVKYPTLGWFAVNNVSQRYYLLISFNPIEHKYTVRNLPLKIRSIDFSGRNTGIAVGEGGGYFFRDGNWRQLKLPLSVDFRAVKFNSNNTVFICGEKGSLIKGTENRWEVIETSITETLRDMDFVSENEGWFVGSSGVILHYKDGELTQEIAESTQDLWAVEMISADSGFAVGQNGTILKYNGEFWDLIDINSDIDFHDIEIISEKTGFIVGARGAIVKLSVDVALQNRQHRFLFEDQVHLGSDYLMDRIDDVYGITAADFNGDQLPDLYFTCYKSLNHLLINKGGGYYIDRVIESGTGGNIETRIGKEKYEYGSLAADFDRDGNTDIFLAGKRKTSRYLVNNGKAVFEDMTESSELPEYLEIVDGALGDFNKDGYPDLALADVNRGLRIIINKKYNTFKELNLDYLKLPLTGIRAVKVADINNDQHQDIMVIYHHKQPLFLLNTDGLHWRIPEQNMISGQLSDFINSITFSDFNKDGYSDFYLCTEDGNDGLYIFNSDTNKFINQADSWNLRGGGRSYSAVAGDFNLDGYQDLYVSRYNQDLLYINQGNSKFKELGADLIYSKSGYLSGYNTGAVATDINKNGRIDLVIGNSDYWSSILQNRFSGNTFIKIVLNSVQDTKEALGAKIWLWESGVEKSEDNLFAYQEILPSNGLFSQNWHVPVFGLGKVEKVDIKIRFLNGEEFLLKEIKSGEVLEVNQSYWLTAQMFKVSRAFMQFLHIPNMIWEILKFMLFLAFILGSVRFIEYRYRWRPAHAVLYVLILITINVLFTIFMEQSGIFYHILPFSMVVFALIVLIVVNEPIRRAGHIREYRQEKIHQASIQLSRSPKIEEAFAIVINTLKLIQPYNYLFFYTYHNFGNYFLLKGIDGNAPQAIQNKFALKRDKVQKLLEIQQLIDFKQFSRTLGKIPDEFNDSYFFALTRKKEILGLIVINVDMQSQEDNIQNIETIKYLLLQLSIALDNIRILQNLQEQENIAAIGSFAGGIIHNLKNPIDGLRMIIEMLKNDTAENDPKKEYVDELYSGVLELKERLIHSFDFISYGDEMTEVVSINEIVRDILKSYDRSNYSPFNLSMEDEIFKVKGDREQLTFAIENVIQNAVEASDLSNPIEISLKSLNEKNMAEIRVVDKGKGIPDENLDKIFNMFYSTRGKSRGLGLTLTRNIIKNHKGFINVTSEQEKGTEFKIVLPVTKGHNE